MGKSGHNTKQHRGEKKNTGFMWPICIRQRNVANKIDKLSERYSAQAHLHLITKVVAQTACIWKVQGGIVLSTFL